MVNLVQMNTPRVVMQETKKAFRNIFKRGNIESAAQALCNLKGVGPTMASGTRIGTITVNTSNTLKEKKTQVGKVNFVNANINGY
jgi:hypothetical protein